MKKRWEERLWTRRGEGGLAGRAARSPLTALSGLYRLGVAARTAAYRAGLLKVWRSPAKVIVVGNLTVGGTGKTPLAAYIARRLKEQDFRVAVILRGYKSRGGTGPRVVSEGHGLILPPEEAGDEAALLAKRLREIPVVVAADRFPAAQLAVEKFGATHLVLDDGFQRLALERDVNILVLDSARDPAAEYLLPRGPLREPLAAARRADGLVFSRAPGPQVPDWEWIEKICPDLPAFALRYRPLGLTALTGEAIRPLALPSLLFSGIGSPQGFTESFREAGGVVVASVDFEDHHAYGPEDIQRLVKAAPAAGAERLVTTEKDAVKIKPEWARGFPLEVFRVEPDFMGQEDRFWELVLRLIGEKGQAA